MPVFVCVRIRDKRKRNGNDLRQINCEIICLSFVIWLSVYTNFNCRARARFSLRSTDIAAVLSFLWSPFFEASWLWSVIRIPNTLTHTHTRAPFDTIHTQKRAHYLWSNSKLANRLLYNSMPSYYIYYIEQRIFLFRRVSVCALFSDISTYGYGLKNQSKAEKSFTKSIRCFMSKCRKWRNILCQEGQIHARPLDNTFRRSTNAHLVNSALWKMCIANEKYAPNQRYILSFIRPFFCSLFIPFFALFEKLVRLFVWMLWPFFPPREQ